MSKIKHDVYQYTDGKSNSKLLFSRGVTREFGENKVVFTDGHQIIASVQPLNHPNGLELIGYLYS